MPLAVFLTGSALTLLLWRLEERQERAQLISKIAMSQAQFAERLERSILTQTRPLRRLTNDWLQGRVNTEKAFTDAADSLTDYITGSLMIAQVDAAGRCVAVSPAARYASLRGADLLAHPEWAELLQSARMQSEGAAGSVTRDPQDVPYIPAAFAVARGGQHLGWVIGHIRMIALREAFDDTLSRIGFRVRINEGMRVVLEIGVDRQVDGSLGPSAGSPVHVLNRRWMLHARPSPAFIAANDTSLRHWVLGAGEALSALAAVVCVQVVRQHRRERWRTRQNLSNMEMLHRISTAISARMGAGDSALDQLAAAAAQLLGLSMAAIARADDSGEALEMVATWGVLPHVPRRLSSWDEFPLTRRCFLENLLITIDDTHESELSFNRDVFDRLKLRALMAIPLNLENRPIGVLYVADSLPHRFTAEEVQLARLLGAQAAVIMANDRLYRQTREALEARNRLLEQRDRLSVVNSAIYRAVSLDQTLRRIVELAPHALGVELCAVGLITEEFGELHVAAGNEPAQPIIGRRIALEHSIAQQALARQRIIFANPAAGDVVHPCWGQMDGIESLAFVPLFRADQSPLGVIVLGRASSDPWPAERVDLLSVFASHSAGAIENARLHHQTRVALEMQKSLLRQRETLAAVNAAIYQAVTLEQTLKMIVERAPLALGVDVCVVSLITPGGDELAIAAGTEPLGSTIVGRRFSLADTNVARVLYSRRPVVVENAEEDDLDHPELRRLLQAGSVLYVPLFRGDRQPLGVMVFVRHTAGTFGHDMLEMAEIFSTRAMAAIEAARLHEQTRHDAETKAMLLRELNHRVKNNLAGIVGLLSMDQPVMPPRVQRWLDRVIDRIGNIARAHELFSGGTQRVALRDLVRQVLPVVTLGRPGGVRAELDLDGADVQLGTERAVSLAMVLHELCYNAVVHGSDDDGVLDIRARTHEGRIRIEISDRGRRGQSPPAHSTGMGLKLVQGLVGRELQGTFELVPRPGGGMVARVDIPIRNLEQEETP